MGQVEAEWAAAVLLPALLLGEAAAEADLLGALRRCHCRYLDKMLLTATGLVDISVYRLGSDFLRYEEAEGLVQECGHIVDFSDLCTFLSVYTLIRQRGRDPQVENPCCNASLFSSFQNEAQSYLNRVLCVVKAHSFPPQQNVVKRYFALLLNFCAAFIVREDTAWADLVFNF